MDMALQAYKEAVEYNPADFSVFHSMAVILFFEKGNSADALSCLREAAALAEPYSKHHAAMSWLYLSYVHRSRQELEDAYDSTHEALTLDPAWPEARYQHAVHCALNGMVDEMEENLVASIQADPTYFPKIAADPDLMPVHRARHVQEILLDQVKKEVKEWKGYLQHLTELIDSDSVGQRWRNGCLYRNDESRFLFWRGSHVEEKRLGTAWNDLEGAIDYSELVDAISTVEQA